MRYIERLLCASAARTCSSYPRGTPVILAGWHPCGLIYGRALTSLGLRWTRRGGAPPFLDRPTVGRSDRHDAPRSTVSPEIYSAPINLPIIRDTNNSSARHKQRPTAREILANTVSLVNLTTIRVSLTLRDYQRCRNDLDCSWKLLRIRVMNASLNIRTIFHRYRVRNMFLSHQN